MLRHGISSHGLRPGELKNIGQIVTDGSRRSQIDKLNKVISVIFSPVSRKDGNLLSLGLAIEQNHYHNNRQGSFQIFITNQI